MKKEEEEEWGMMVKVGQSTRSWTLIIQEKRKIDRLNTFSNFSHSYKKKPTQKHIVLFSYVNHDNDKQKIEDKCNIRWIVCFQL